MKTRNYLLPYSYKKVGMWMFLPFAALCLCLFLSSFFNLNLPEIKVPWIAVGDNIFYKGEANLVSTLGMLGFLVSLCFIALSREKDEDEMTGQIRMQSFVWSWWVTAIILALGILFIMGLDFLVFTCAAIFLYFLVYIMKFNLMMKAIRREGK
jgi:hypothetical protein